MGVLPRQLKPWMILGGTVTLLLIGLIAGAAMLLAALKVMTYVSRKRSVSKTIKSLKGSGYNQHDDLDEAEIHPATNSIAWDFGNLIARFYYFPGKKAGSSMRLFHITENGSREPFSVM